MHCREERKVTYAALMLVGAVEPWWWNKQRLLEAEGQVIAVELFRDYFLEKYFLKSIGQVKKRELTSLQQGNMFVG